MNNILKKGLIYTAAFLSAGIMTSCESTLEEVVYSELTSENAFKTKDDATAAVNSMYEPLHGVSNRAIFYLNDMTTDACFMKEMDCELLNELKMSTNQDVSSSWNGYYKIVSRANIALDKIPEIPDTEFGDDEAVAAQLKNRLLAEAYFMRGFAYYQLTDLYYTVPLVIGSDVAVDAILPPASIEEIETQIDKDLNAAKAALPQSYSDKLDAGRATYGAAAGFLCRLHMRAAGRARLSGGDDASEWRKALEYANEVLALNGSVYSLQAKVWDVFNPETDATLYNNELIFTVRSSQDIPSGSSDIGMNFTPWDYDMGWNLFSVPLELTWKFDKADERYSELLVEIGRHDSQLSRCFQCTYSHQDTQEEKDRCQVDIRQQLCDTQLFRFMDMQTAVHNVGIYPENDQSEQYAQERRQVCQHLKYGNQCQRKDTDHKYHPAGMIRYLRYKLVGCLFFTHDTQPGIFLEQPEVGYRQRNHHIDQCMNKYMGDLMHSRHILSHPEQDRRHITDRRPRTTGIRRNDHHTGILQTVGPVRIRSRNSAIIWIRCFRNIVSFKIRSV